MKIIRASTLGFCFGVRRAVDFAEKALLKAKESDGKVCSLGPLIHNEEVLSDFATRGLEIIDEDQIKDLPKNSTVIVRAHGVSKSVFETLEKQGCLIVDATCPRVKASQKLAERYTSDNDYVILTGDKNHGEVKGIAGYAGKNFIQIQNREEAQGLDLDLPENANVLLLSQTTYNPKEFLEITNILKEKISNLEVMNTVCPATSERQQALRELCSQVDGLLVIGGKASANTKRLYQTAAENCRKAALIQTADDIPQEFFGLERVGIAAGASTPDKIINEVEERLKGK